VSDVTTVVAGTGAARSPWSPEPAPIIEIGSLAELPVAARRATTRWLWLVDASAVPAPDALPALLAHADRPAVSLPVDAQGITVEPLIGRFTEADVPGILDAVRRRSVPLRHAHVISLLVARELATALGAPDPSTFGPWAGTEWTARLFARERGMLVPASRVCAAPPARPSAAQVLRMARTGVWHRGELLREVHRSARSAAWAARA
jgi:hypothetical protein